MLIHKQNPQFSTNNTEFKINLHVIQQLHGRNQQNNSKQPQLKITKQKHQNTMDESVTVHTRACFLCGQLVNENENTSGMNRFRCNEELIYVFDEESESNKGR